MISAQKIVVTNARAMAEESIQPMPMLTIMMNTRCNQQCAYCPPMGESYMCSPGDLEPEVAEEILKVGLSRGVRVVRFSGGEPTLHPRFADFIGLMRLAKEAGAIVHLNSNGVLLGRYLSVIDNEVVSSLRVSLDSLDPNKYHQITGTNILNSVLANIVAARAKKLHVDLIMVVMRHNVDEIDDIIRFCAQHDVGLKLSDLERHEFEQQGFWEDQFIPIQTISSSLRVRAAKVEVVIPVGTFGMAMTDYWIDGVKVRVKDSFVSAIYTNFCRSSCAVFPCPEGVYSLLLKPDATLSWCKRNSKVAVKILPGMSEEVLGQCVENLQSCASLDHGASHVRKIPDDHWLHHSTQVEVQVTQGVAGHGCNDWQYVGGQRGYGRDR